MWYYSWCLVWHTTQSSGQRSFCYPYPYLRSSLRSALTRAVWYTSHVVLTYFLSIPVAEVNVKVTPLPWGVDWGLIYLPSSAIRHLLVGGNVPTYLYMYNLYYGYQRFVELLPSLKCCLFQISNSQPSHSAMLSKEHFTGHTTTLLTAITSLFKETKKISNCYLSK